MKTTQEFLDMFEYKDGNLYWKKHCFKFKVNTKAGFNSGNG